MPHVIRNLKINSVAHVDRGAGDGVKVLLWKRDDDGEPYWKREFSSDQRDSMAGKGQALPDGSFPIANRGDLQNAIRAIGRAKNPGKAKAHIRSRARALGASDLIPESWGKALALTADELAGLLKTLDVPADKHQAAVKAVEKFDGWMVRLAADETLTATDASAMANKGASTFKAHLVEKVGLDAGMADQLTSGLLAAFVAKGDDEMDKETEKMIADAVTKAVTEATKGLTDTIAKQAHELVMLKMSDAHKAYHDQLGTDEAKKAFAAKKPEDREDQMEKEPAKKGLDKLDGAIAKVIGPILATSETLTKRNAELETTVKGLVEKDDIAKFEKKATDLGLPATHGAVMRKAYAGDADAIKKHEEMLAGIVKQATTGVLFAEFGGGGGAGGTTAYDQLMGKAKELVAKVEKTASGKPLTLHQAFAKVYTDPINAELAKQQRQEESGRRRRAA